MDKLKLLEEMWEKQEQIRRILAQAQVMQDQVKAHQQRIDQINQQMRQIKQDEVKKK